MFTKTSTVPGQADPVGTDSRMRTGEWHQQQECDAHPNGQDSYRGTQSRVSYEVSGVHSGCAIHYVLTRHWIPHAIHVLLLQLTLLLHVLNSFSGLANEDLLVLLQWNELILILAAYCCFLDSLKVLE